MQHDYGRKIFRMKKRTILSLLMLISTFSIYGQSYFEFGFQIGPGLYFGDVSADKVNGMLKETNLFLGAQARWNMNSRLSLGLELMYGKLEGNDAFNSQSSRVLRNFSFESPIIQVALLGEINILKFSLVESKSLWTPYLKGGIAGFHFNPRTFYKGQWVDLQPLGTEGQGTSDFPDRKKYRLYEYALPGGGGVKVQMTDRLSIAVEALYYITFTDYIDDVSKTYPSVGVLSEENGSLAVELSYRQDEIDGSAFPKRQARRGSPGVKDYYFIGTVGIRYVFDTLGGSLFSVFRRSRVKCPTF